MLTFITLRKLFVLFDYYFFHFQNESNIFLSFLLLSRSRSLPVVGCGCLLLMDFTHGSVAHESTCQCHTKDVGLIPGSGRSPGVGNGNPLQYSYMENSMGSIFWQATRLWTCKESDMSEQQSRRGPST